MKEGRFTSSLKKENIVHIHKICTKAFEGLISNSIYKFLSNNSLVSHSQSGFRTLDSCINKLFSISHDIFHSFDNYELLEVEAVFLDISKA